MTAQIFVTLKKTVLDPQGQTIQRALNSMGHPEVASVRQGKYFEIELTGVDKATAEATMAKLAEDVLSNPVIEEFRIEITG
ncbi:MAG: phosphoribosylformylglycinamidine synthase subunit PurS [Bryobacteraceae bacterium]|nr:phosphoribosylformylglycinamidine synthase subunit PurS [Bryobacteraceae bacterium]